MQVLGLWGMGGIGKTTLAAKLFNSLLPGFGDAACFLGNVRSEAGQAGGLVKAAAGALGGFMWTWCCCQGRGKRSAPMDCKHMLAYMVSFWWRISPWLYFNVEQRWKHYRVATGAHALYR